MTTRGAHILVIEDRYYVRNLLGAVLREFGYQPSAFESAAEALERLPELQPDLVLLDMEMPGMNGREFLQRIRADARWAELPVLIISGFADTVPPGPGRSLAVLAKPFENTTLLQWIEEMLPPPAARAAAQAV